MFKRTQGRHRKAAVARHRRPTELGHIHTVVLAFVVCVGLLPAAARVFS
jgi:hypothetical protein